MALGTTAQAADCTTIDFEDIDTGTPVFGLYAVSDLLSIYGVEPMEVLQEDLTDPTNLSILAYNSNVNGQNGEGGENWLPGENAKSFGNSSGVRGADSQNLLVEIDPNITIASFAIDIADYGDWFPIGGADPRKVTLTAFDSDDSMLASTTLSINYDNPGNDVFTYGALRNLEVSENGAIAYVTLEFEDMDPGVSFDNIEICYLDSDDDGVRDDDDLCPETIADEDAGVPSSVKGLGKNRWIWNGEEWFTNAQGVDKSFTIEETQGCSCEQILEILVDKTGESFDGHYKFGCSQSVVEEWIDGWYPLEVVEVPSNDVAGADSQSMLFSGEDYKLIASGEWYNFSDNSRAVDAEYISDDAWLTYVDGPPALVPDQLDLQVDESFQDWGAYSSSHEYSIDYAGVGNTVNFRVFDGDAVTNTPNVNWYTDNDGSLLVAILLKLW
jgi:hypothetical protein